MALFFAWIAGLIFGIGLLVSGMTNPAKVLGFLDLTGAWDPSLAFVMAGAIAVATLGFWLARNRTRSLLGLPMNLPTARHVDRRLIIGSLLFGFGWGLAGICPGPSLVLLGSGIFKGAVFVVAMLAGMALFEWFERQKRRGSFRG
ncbi:DUF6691 family protein [Pseudomonas sp. NPDC087336]|uniref:DUF6691 family protein n=1 Tax=Pseudomonas sp. NPDC087336 TaxID=3364436 RepID=UPI00382A907D